MKPDFSKAQNEATNLLLKQSFDSLSIDIRKFEFGDKKIIIDSIQHYANTVNYSVSDFTCKEISGCCVLKERKYGYNIILYDNDSFYEERKHWGIIHEVGHIYLNHQDDSPKSEIEANFFAAQIVMPEQILRYIRNFKGSLNIDEIYEHFNVSYESAQKRFYTLNRNKAFYTVTPKDRLLINKFKPIIQNEFLDNISLACI